MSASSRIARWLGALGVAASLFAPAAQAADTIAVASLGSGAVEIVWVPEDGNWPAGGWRLERVGPAGTAVTVARQLGPGLDTAAVGRLARDEAAGLAQFAAKLRAGTLTADEKGAADAILVIAALVRPDYGRALGVRFRDQSVPAGETFYRLIALSPAGASLRVSESDLVDTREATPLPFPPETVAVDPTPEGMAIVWQDPPNVADTPILGYRVTRVAPGAPTDLTPDLVLRARAQPGAPPRRMSVLDRTVQRNNPATYEIASVDIFGRASVPKRIEVSLGAIARATAPSGVSAVAGVESAVVSWQPVPARGVAGYVVERSLFIGGPYEALSADGLPPTATRTQSAGLLPGTAYFFRVRIFDADGNLGLPSLPAKAIPTASGPPAAPRGLAADGGPTRVALTWDAPGRVAGYFVYRRLDGQQQWTRLNGIITTENAFIDRFERGAFSQAKVLYRVQAIGYDNQEGAFSAEVTVTFGDTLAPPVPRITAGTGTGGSAHVTFAPGIPEDDAAGFVVLRADDRDLPGKVVGDMLARAARVYDDPDVTPGGTYWYEVVTVDAAGNRSGVSNRVAVDVGAPALPAAPAPRATYHPTPFPYVELVLATPPAKTQAYVEAQVNGGKWLVVAGPVADFTTINVTTIPAGAAQVTYRVVYQSENGARGAPSPTVDVSVR